MKLCASDFSAFFNMATGDDPVVMLLGTMRG
jgi:hypothetical protein